MRSPVAPSSANAVMSEAEFAQIVSIARTEAGLSLSDSKRTMVASRLRRRLQANGIASFEAYLALLDSRKGLEERRKLISALTTNVSHFFREEHHFHTVVTELLASGRGSGHAERLRFWSAGCARGQEPYSLAITILRHLPDAVSRGITILATDIDEAALESAESGRYALHQMQGVGPEDRNRYFRAAPEGDFEIRPEVRALVRFEQLNLVGRWPAQGHFNAIFCRNVVIYFDSPTQALLWPRFHAALAGDGILFIGHSERLDPANAVLFRTMGVTSYRKIDGTRHEGTGGTRPWH